MSSCLLNVFIDLETDYYYYYYYYLINLYFVKNLLFKFRLCVGL
jgi:hypothetical protein